MTVDTPVGTDTGVVTEAGLALAATDGVEAGAVTEVGTVLALAIGTDSAALTESAVAATTLALDGVDTSAVSEQVVTALAAVAVDQGALTDTGLTDLASTVVDSAALSESGVAEEGAPEFADVDSASVTEAITALLVEVSAVDEFIVTDTGPAPPAPPSVPQEDVYAAPRMWSAEQEPELDEALLVSAIAAWEYY